MKHFILSLGAAAALLVAAASANTVQDSGYSAAFPCQAKVLKQTVAAGTMKIPLVSNSCEAGGAIYSVVMSTFPNGFIAKRTLKKALGDAVIGAAINVKGTVRTETLIVLDGVNGRDALIDVANPQAVAHLRVFYVGDKQFQVMVITPKGQEHAKPAEAFVKSFKLVP